MTDRVERMLCGFTFGTAGGVVIIALAIIASASPTAAILLGGSGIVGAVCAWLWR